MSEFGDYRVKFTAAQMQKMKKLYTDGATCEELSKIYGLHSTAIAERLRRAGVAMRGAHRRCKLSEKDIAKIAYYREMKVSWNVIEAMYPAKRRNMRDYIKAYNASKPS